MSGSPREVHTPAHGLFSPEGVRLDLDIAGPSPRMMAYGIDLLIIVVLVIALLVTLPAGHALFAWFASLLSRIFPSVQDGKVKAGSAEAGEVFAAIFLLIQFAIETGYFIFWEIVTGGRSPGKALAGLRVVQRNGMPIEMDNIIVRNLFRIVDILPSSYVVGLISIVLSPGGERLGDHAAGTIVIRLDRPFSAPEIEVSAKPESLSLTREQLARIGRREIRLIRGTLRRLERIPEDRREPLLAEVSETLRQRLELAEIPGADRRKFLLELLAAAERYTTGRAG
jgi:uncharacterized RDD family membrane protein YckC